MSIEQTTCWTMIRDAAAGDAAARDSFASLYEPAARAYLEARWNASQRSQDVHDALQDVFIECFRDGGVLVKVDGQPPSEFRPFFFGVVRNVARRYEQRPVRDRAHQPDTQFMAQQPAPDEDRLTRVFDRAWAQGVMRQAAEHHRRAADASGDAQAIRRVELLELRFREGLPIRKIAARWGEPPEQVHRAYARARQEFQESLDAVVATLHPGASGGERRQHAADLLQMLA